MTRRQVIDKLKAEGFEATVGRLRQALINGYVRPLPKKGAGRAFDFQPQHLRQLRRYFVCVRPGPMPLFPVKWPIRGPYDRAHRLASEKQRLRERGPSQRVLRRQRRREADAAIGVLEGIAGELER